MFNRGFIYFQYLIPQVWLSQFVGFFANSRHTFIKNTFIKIFLKLYRINMQEALIEDPYSYATFNDFFTRELKPTVRPIAKNKNSLVSPVDGTIAAIGEINQNQLLQAKNFYFDLLSLLGNDQAMANLFTNGSFATVYLAPYNYHRVHMPIEGKLIKTIYVPGKLFSVNKITTDLIPSLYSRNERFIALFETQAGPVAVILVGALIVGSIQMAWMDKPFRHSTLCIDDQPKPLHLEKGAELGSFKLGSTVIILAPNKKLTWDVLHQPGTTLRLGEHLGQLSLF